MQAVTSNERLAVGALHGPAALSTDQLLQATWAINASCIYDKSRLKSVPSQVCTLPLIGGL
jgi:hypothetical protein